MKTNSSNLRRFLSYARPYRWWLVFSTVVGVIKYNLPVTFPWILKDVIDHLLSGKPSQIGLGFDQLMGLAVLLFLFYAVITHLRTYIADHLAQAMIFDVRRDLFQHLQKLPVDFFQKYRTGTISSRLITDEISAPPPPFLMVHEFLNSEGFLEMRVEETKRIEEGI